jgi:hypothetical protein
MNESLEAFVPTPAADVGWSRRTPRADDSRLLAHTWDWLNALPKAVRPVHLPADFPRIANDLSRLWPETAALDAYFADKEFSPREGRQGFAPLIKEELLAVHVYSLRTRALHSDGRAPQKSALVM